MEQHIIPECYIDTRLVKTLLPHKGRYNHQHGCSNVEKIIKVKLKGEFALGIIDKDKKALKYLDKCQLVCEMSGFSQLFKHKVEHHYLIIIRPAMERWIMNTTVISGLSLLDFDLPDTLDKLCDITKTSKDDKDDLHAPKFYRLFREVNRINPPSITVLKFWITYLKNNPYKADLAHIIEQTILLQID